MPELPEVETVARSLRRQLPAPAFMIRAELRHASLLKFGEQHWRELDGCELGEIGRAGKYLWIACRKDGQEWKLLLHLGMSGRLTVEAPEREIEPHTHAIFHLAGGRQLRFRDPRRFGRIGVARMEEANGSAGLTAVQEKQLGIPSGREPLEIGEAEFVKLFRGRKGPLKNLLLNQRLLRGLGNIYADESLHRAGISPRARGVGAARLKRLRKAVRQVLEEAIRAGGSSIADYMDSERQRGWFQTRHRVYGRTGQPCRKCGTMIRRSVLGGRSAHHCPRCQRH